jgi:hypothetical protein
MSRDRPNHLDFRDEWRRQVLADSRLAPSQKLAAVVIADRADYSGKPFRLGHEYIASSCGVGKRTVRRSIAKLLELRGLSNYRSGRIADSFKYTSEFEINFSFLSNNSSRNAESDRPSWQVEFIKNGVIDENGAISLSGQRCPPNKDKSPKGTNGTLLKRTNGTSSKGTIVSTTPSISSELQRAGNKEGETTMLSADAPNGALPTLSLQDYENGFSELQDAFRGKIDRPKDAFNAYVKELKLGRVNQQYLVDKAKLQAESIDALDWPMRPNLDRWLRERLYEKKMQPDKESAEVFMT